METNNKMKVNDFVCDENLSHNGLHGYATLVFKEAV